MIFSFMAGFVVGSTPTAQLIARRAGVDLGAGSGNPGANNARRLGGWKLAALVLGVEMAKGAAAVAVVQAISTDPAAIAAGIGAVAGNVFNPWLRFQGGQGLGATAGVLLASWPLGLAIGVPVIALGAKLVGSTYRATILALTVLLLTSTAAARLSLPWGIGSDWMWLTSGLFVLVVPKQIALIRRSGLQESPE